MCEPAEGQHSASTHLGELGSARSFGPAASRPRSQRGMDGAPLTCTATPSAGPASQPSSAGPRLSSWPYPCCPGKTMAEERSHCRFPNRMARGPLRKGQITSNRTQEVNFPSFHGSRGRGDARLELIIIETVSPKVILLHFIFWLSPLLLPPPSAAWLISQHLGSWSPSLGRPEPCPLSSTIPWAVFSYQCLQRG